MAHTGMDDPGHGGFDPGAMGNGLRECDLTWKFGTKFAAIMERCGVKMFFTREQNSTATNNKNAELGYRCKLANQKGVSFYIAFHINAGGGTGFESYRYTGNNAATVRLQQLVHRNVAPIFTSSGIHDRGMKTADFAVLRGTDMPAILLELGFIDNARDTKYIASDDFQNKVAEAVARAVCEWLGVTYVGAATPTVVAPTPSPAIKEIPATVNGVSTKAIVVGGNTHLIWRFLKNVGLREGSEFSYEFTSAASVKFKVFGVDVPAVVYNGDSYLQWNRVPTIREPQQRKDGGWDFTMPKFTPPVPVPQGESIMGESRAVVEQLLGHARSVNPDFPTELASLYLETAKRYGIRGDIAFAQMLKETKYFLFGGDVKKEQNNFAGLGAIGDGVEGASFPTPAVGVTAHMQHLFAYSCTAGLPPGEALVDYRFALVSRGLAPTWDGLNGHWSVPGDNYGQEILAIYQKIMEFTPAVHQVDPAGEAIKKLVDVGIIQTPDYWEKLLAGQVAFNPEYFKTLISRVAEKL